MKWRVTSKMYKVIANLTGIYLSVLKFNVLNVLCLLIEWVFRWLNIHITNKYTCKTKMKNYTFFVDTCYISIKFNNRLIVYGRPWFKYKYDIIKYVYLTTILSISILDFMISTWFPLIALYNLLPNYVELDF